MRTWQAHIHTRSQVQHVEHRVSSLQQVLDNLSENMPRELEHQVCRATQREECSFAQLTSARAHASTLSQVRQIEHEFAALQKVLKATEEWQATNRESDRKDLAAALERVQFFAKLCEQYKDQLQDRAMLNEKVRSRCAQLSNPWLTSQISTPVFFVKIEFARAHKVRVTNFF